MASFQVVDQPKKFAPSLTITQQPGGKQSFRVTDQEKPVEAEAPAAAPAPRKNSAINSVFDVETNAEQDAKLRREASQKFKESQVEEEAPEPEHKPRDPNRIWNEEDEDAEEQSENRPPVEVPKSDMARMMAHQISPEPIHTIRKVVYPGKRNEKSTAEMSIDKPMTSRTSRANVSNNVINLTPKNDAKRWTSRTYRTNLESQPEE